MAFVEHATSQPVPPRSIRAGGAFQTVLAAATAIFVLLLQLKIGTGFPHNIDASWGEVLNWGFAHGAQWGKDLVFTYGPLGFASPGLPFDPSTYWATLALRFAIAAITAWLVLINLRRLPLATTVAFALASIVTGLSWATSSALIIVFPLAILALERVANGQAPTHHATRQISVAALAAFAAIQPLIKFSVFPLWVAWLPLGTFMLWRSRNRWLVLNFVITSALTVVIVWLACAQQLQNLGVYYYWSWKVAAYYAAAMQAPPHRPITDWIALGAILFGLACTALLAWRRRRNPTRVASYVMFAVVLALTYKAGATRASDGGHVMLIWSICAWCAPLLTGMWREDSGLHGRRHALAGFVLAILALSLPFVSWAYPKSTLYQLYSGHASFAGAARHLKVLTNPLQSFNGRLAQWTRDRKALALPLISRTVGNDTVDILTYDQGALLANDLNYRPRPVFQSYSAYSGKLARLNGEFFLSTRAPKWVILNWKTVGKAYPTSDDTRALARILQSYRPVLAEADYLLFRHDATSATALGTGKPAFAVPIGFTAMTRVPHSPAEGWFAKVDVGLTPYGKLEALLFRAPKLMIEVGFEDGTTRQYSLVRDIARTGFILSPGLDGNYAYLQWLRGDTTRTVTSIRLVQKKVLNHRAFVVNGPLRLYPLHLSRQYPKTVALFADSFPGFSDMPVDVSGSSRSYSVDGKRVMFLPAPGSLTFQLPAGTYDASAQFGIMPNALTNAACLAAHADGVGIQIAASRRGQPSMPIASSSLDPYKDASHRYASTFASRVTVNPGEDIVISLTSGPAGSTGACDWSWIRDVRFTKTLAPSHNPTAERSHDPAGH